MPHSGLEAVEKLEQLRALEHGMDLRVEDAAVLPGPDVNTAADLDRVAALLGVLPVGVP
jgi:CMP-2-keto-3-deoxyoctulosonic acid synthetase